ncbi:phenoloxidase subunit 2-like, partial [Trichoplusia ni]|uniref:Phenoloxidase subunit 2-like n=1 Tax=Trichoplusia ni TaxID=7111 RepID=A0A7E5WY17_TRINI
MADVVESLKLLFDRPNEPLITPKGDKKAVFQLTESFVPPEYANNGVELNNRFGDDASEKIPLKHLSVYPSFPKASQLPADADFSLFLPKHQDMATEVIDAFMNVPQNELQDFLSTCVYARANLNPQLFNYCYSVALMHRDDTKNVPIQNFAETFPSKFMDSRVFQRAREVSAVVPQNVPV